jgi:hypothetical protein
MESKERKSSLISVLPIFIVLLGVMALGTFDEGAVSEPKLASRAVYQEPSPTSAAAMAPLKLDPGRFLIIREASIGEGDQLKITFRDDRGYAVEVTPEIVRTGLAIVEVPIYTDPATGQISEGEAWVYMKELKSAKPVFINKLITN